MSIREFIRYMRPLQSEPALSLRRMSSCNRNRSPLSFSERTFLSERGGDGGAGGEREALAVSVEAASSSVDSDCGAILLTLRMPWS